MDVLLAGLVKLTLPEGLSGFPGPVFPIQAWPGHSPNLVYGIVVS